MFYFFGTEVHRSGRSYLTHGEWVEHKVMIALNITYVHLSELAIGQRTCVQQLYAKKFNDLRTNIMRSGSAIQHKSMVKKEQPKVTGLFHKNFKRAKTVFFVTLDVGKSEDWHKVSCIYKNNRQQKYAYLTKLWQSGRLCHRCRMDYVGRNSTVLIAGEEPPTYQWDIVSFHAREQ